MQPEHSLFDLLVLSLGNAALISLGVVVNPESQELQKDIDGAGYNIELLEMLKQKTRNNLSSTESNLLTQLIYDLQLKYVEAKNNHDIKHFM